MRVHPPLPLVPFSRTLPGDQDQCDISQYGARFEPDFYHYRHLPVLKEGMFEILTGDMPGESAPYLASCHLHRATVEVSQTGFGPQAAEIAADIPHFTDLRAVIQKSQVVLDVRE